MSGRILLIGMPAAGKTTVGAALAQALSLPFFDCDAEVEREAGRTVAQLFAAEGEAGFRLRERRALERLCRTEERCVIATGGGAVLTEENRALLRRSGTVYWLDRAPESLLAAKFAAGRPLLTGGAEALLALYDRRRPLYERCAHHRIEDGTVREMTARILQTEKETP